MNSAAGLPSHCMTRIARPMSACGRSAEAARQVTPWISHPSPGSADPITHADRLSGRIAGQRTKRQQAPFIDRRGGPAPRHAQRAERRHVGHQPASPKPSRRFRRASTPSSHQLARMGQYRFVNPCRQRWVRIRAGGCRTRARSAASVLQTSATCAWAVRRSIGP
jgi:hypothetical protein